MKLLDDLVAFARDDPSSFITILGLTVALMTIIALPLGLVTLIHFIK